MEPRQVAEEIREFKNCRMTIVRMDCSICGRELSRGDSKWKELRERWANRD